MNKTSLVMKFAVKNQLRMTATTVITLAIIFICVAGTIAILAALILNPEMEKTAPDMSVVQKAMGVTLFCASFISIGIYTSVFSYQSLVKREVQRQYSGTIATPFPRRNCGLGKSLAVFLPGLVFTIILTIAAFLVLNLIYFTGDTDSFLLSGCLSATCWQCRFCIWQ
jgi:hypothetical protein